VRQSERQLAAATARIGVATAELYPDVTLNGSVGSAATTFSGLFTRSALSYGVAGNTPSTLPLISWTFPNISVARAHIRESTAQASAALAGFDGTVLTSLKETEQALAIYVTELDHHIALAAARDHANDALRLADIQYKAGVNSALDLLVSQQTAVSAEQAVAASDQAISADQVGVFQALGGGWENAPKVTPPVVK
jgi:outer membrane protein TolC